MERESNGLHPDMLFIDEALEMSSENDFWAGVRNYALWQEQRTRLWTRLRDERLIIYGDQLNGENHMALDRLSNTARQELEAKATEHGSSFESWLEWVQELFTSAWEGKNIGLVSSGTQEELNSLATLHSSKRSLLDEAAKLAELVWHNVRVKQDPVALERHVVGTTADGRDRDPEDVRENWAGGKFASAGVAVEELDSGGSIDATGQEPVSPQQTEVDNDTKDDPYPVSKSWD